MRGGQPKSETKRAAAGHRSARDNDLAVGGVVHAEAGFGSSQIESDEAIGGDGFISSYVRSDAILIG